MALVQVDYSNDGCNAVLFGCIFFTSCVHVLYCLQYGEKVWSKERLWSFLCKNTEAVGNVASQLAVGVLGVFQEHLEEVIEVDVNRTGTGFQNLAEAANRHYFVALWMLVTEVRN